MRVLPRVEAGISRYVVPLPLDSVLLATSQTLTFFSGKVLSSAFPADISTMNLRARNI